MGTTKKLRTTQRKMLRWMLGSARKKIQVEASSNQDEQNRQVSDNESECTNSEPEEEEDETAQSQEVLEDWVEWLKRTTGLTDQWLQKLHIEDWVRQQRRNQWRWAGHVTRLLDQRWT